MASGKTELLNLPLLLGSDFVNSNDFNNGMEKIDSNAVEVKNRLDKLEVETGGAGEGLEGVNQTIQEMRDDLASLETLLGDNNERIITLNAHVNEFENRMLTIEENCKHIPYLVKQTIKFNNNFPITLQGKSDNLSDYPILQIDVSQLTSMQRQLLSQTYEDVVLFNMDSFINTTSDGITRLFTPILSTSDKKQVYISTDNSGTGRTIPSLHGDISVNLYFYCYGRR